MEIKGTLTEFLLTVSLGAILLIVCAILASGIKRTDHGWEIPKAHPIFAWVFFIFAFTVIGFAIEDKYFAKGPALVEEDKLTLHWGTDGRPLSDTDNPNGKQVILSAPNLQPGSPTSVACGWEATTTLANDFAPQPQMLISLVEVPPLIAGHPYELRATPSPTVRNQYTVRVTAWGISNKDQDVRFQVEILAIGQGNSTK